MKLLVQIDLSTADLVMFERYEQAVLPLMSDHGGVLEQRLRAADDSTETHLMSFPASSAFEAYLADPRRLIYTPAFTASGAKASYWEVRDL